MGSDATGVHRDPVRPLLHFTPPRNWMNDPNGLVRIGDTFHLFYQHNPAGIDHANLHWGHASSDDLFTWTHHDVSLYPDELGQIYSGTVAIDQHNTAGFGESAVVAAFTHALPGLQRQSLAYSLDDGETWTKYSGNPVVVPPPGIVDFRDPKLLRYRSESGDEWWVMVVAVGSEVWFYTSRDLKEWERSSVFAPERPWPDATVEVPELIEVPVVGEDRSEWVLILCAHERMADGSITAESMWSPGRFDGLRFESSRDLSRMDRLDHNDRFYAPLAWERGPNQKPVLIAWMDERDRLLNPPPQSWCGRMSLPREITLRPTGGGYALVQKPLLPPDFFTNLVNEQIPAEGELHYDELPSAFRIVVESSGLPDGLALKLRSSDDVRETFDLRIEGPHLVVATGGRLRTGPILLEPGQTERFVLDVIVDAGSIELFLDGGARTASFICGIGLGATRVELKNASTRPIVCRLDTGGSR